MWIVKNTSETVLRLEDLGLEIPPGDYLDIDALGRARAESSAKLRAALDDGRLHGLVKSEDETQRLLEPRRGSELFDELERKLKSDKDALVREIAVIAASATEETSAVDMSRIDTLLSRFNASAISEFKSTIARAERLSQPTPSTAAEDTSHELRAQSPGMGTEFDAFRRLLEEFEMLKELLRDEVHGIVSEFRKVKEGEPAPEDEPDTMPRKRTKLTEADFRARAAIIDDIEREIQKNFDNIGSTVKKQKDRTDLVDKLRGL